MLVLPGAQLHLTVESIFELLEVAVCVHVHRAVDLDTFAVGRVRTVAPRLLMNQYLFLQLTAFPALFVRQIFLVNFFVEVLVYCLERVFLLCGKGLLTVLRIEVFSLSHAWLKLS